MDWRIRQLVGVDSGRTNPELDELELLELYELTDETEPELETLALLALLETLELPELTCIPEPPGVPISFTLQPVTAKTAAANMMANNFLIKRPLF